VSEPGVPNDDAQRPDDSEAQRHCWTVRCSAGFGTCPLCSVKKELDLNGIEREDDSAILHAVKNPGVQ